jgi:DNA gyrase/topoisomerase IV subunit A
MMMTPDKTLKEMLAMPTKQLLHYYKKYYQIFDFDYEYKWHEEYDKDMEEILSMQRQKKIIKMELDEREHVLKGSQKKEIRRYMQQKKVTKEEAIAQLYGK